MKIPRTARRRVFVGTTAVAAVLGVTGLARIRANDESTVLRAAGPAMSARRTVTSADTDGLVIADLPRPPFMIGQHGGQFVANGDSLYAFAVGRLYRLSPVAPDATWTEVARGFPERWASNIVMLDHDRAFVIDGSGSDGGAIAELDLRTGRTSLRGRVAGDLYTGASDARYVYFVSLVDTVRFDTRDNRVEISAAPSALRVPTMVEVLDDGHVFASFLGMNRPFVFLDHETLQWRMEDRFAGYAVVFQSSHAGSGGRAATFALRRNDGLRTFVVTLERRNVSPSFVELVTRSGDTSRCIVPSVAYSESTGVIGAACGELARITPEGSVPAGVLPPDEPYRFVSGNVVVAVFEESNRLVHIRSR
jgi:hypothetical protein